MPLPKNQPHLPVIFHRKDKPNLNSKVVSPIRKTGASSLPHIPKDFYRSPFNKLPYPEAFYRTNFSILAQSKPNTIKAGTPRKENLFSENSIYSVYPYKRQEVRFDRELKTKDKLESKCANHGTYTMCKS